MEAPMFARIKVSGKYKYVQLVENRWEEGRTRQQVFCTLGRLDELQASGTLDSLTESLGRFSAASVVLSARREAEDTSSAVRKIGPALVFDRLWSETGCSFAIDFVLGKNRKFQYSIDRAVFLTVLHRLFSPGSDRAADKWTEEYEISGADGIELHQLYRTMAWLGEPLPDDQQHGRTPFSPRCTKDLIEEALFLKRRDLFTSLDIVFFDTTAIYFEGKGGESIGQYGHSKDHRPDLRQMVVGMILDSNANPVCCELWPGNTADVKSLVPVVDRLKIRFGIKNICIVADRGMISKETIEEIEERKWHYILGARMRSQREVDEDVLGRAGRFQMVYPKSNLRSDPSPLEVKEVRVNGDPQRRYIVCRNADQAKKDAADREAIVASLREQLAKGAKSLVGNKGYRKYIKSKESSFTIDEAKVKYEARCDGKWVLRTNMFDLSPSDVAKKYKQLWMVEDIFRTMKSTLETRPVYHKRDDTIRGHAFCSFLALVLRKELEDRLEAKGFVFEWNDIIRDLDNLYETTIDKDGKRFIVRSEVKRTAGNVFRAVGVAIPQTVRQLVVE